MRGYIKITSFLLVLSMLVGCGLSDPTGADDIKVQIKEMNLDGAKAMAHLQSGNSGTKASMEFTQEDALYLVYDNNEIRLPEIKFTVEAPDSWSAYERKKWMEALHVNLDDPTITDFGEYIYVFSSLNYYIDGNGILAAPPHHVLHPGEMPHRPHSNTLIRKKDGHCLTVDDNIGASLYWTYAIEKDSKGLAYFTSFIGKQICRLHNSNEGIEVKSVDIIDKGGAQVFNPTMQICNDKVYVACYWGLPDEHVGGTALATVSSDLTCERMYLGGVGSELLVFEKYGEAAYLFMYEDSEIKVYNAVSGCELVASVTGGEVHDRSNFTILGKNKVKRAALLSDADGILTVYYIGADAIVRFNTTTGECTYSALDDTIRDYLSAGFCLAGKNFYCEYYSEESSYVEILKIDAVSGTVERLKKLDAPTGYNYYGTTFVLEDESKGHVHLTSVFVNYDGNDRVDIEAEIYDPEIASAYAKANAIEGIDFGTYKVVNVVPLTDDLDSSEN